MTVRVVPWIRTGLALEVTDEAPGGVVDVVRATANVSVRASANDGDESVEAGSQSIELYGPGDVVSLDDKQIRHRYPTPNTPDAEPNFFAFVELVDADLPWRYSPAGPADDDKAPPWLALVVVEEGPEASFDSSGRLPILTVFSAVHLPPPGDLWAWAHAFGEGDPVADVKAFNARVMCPRRLRPHTQWRACLVPAFLTGRNAGLGHLPGDEAGPAWRFDEVNVELPVYSTWTFHTGELNGTFLSLAQKLVPRELGPGVGVRPLDLSDPGDPLPSEAGARTDFVGAMFSPQYDPSGRITADLKEFASTYRAELERPDNGPLDPDAGYDAAVDDPVVRLPQYGSPQRGGASLPDSSEHWYTELNTRPEHRTVAALGASVVRSDQEDLLAAAWEHAASLTQVNESLQRARLAEEMGKQRSAKFSTLDAGHRLQAVGPATDRIRVGSTSLASDLDASSISPVVTGGAFRRMIRPGGVFQRATTVQPATAPVPAPAEHFVTQTITEGIGAFTEALPGYLPAGLDIGSRLESQEPTTGIANIADYQPFDVDSIGPVTGGPSEFTATWTTTTATMVIGSTMPMGLPSGLTFSNPVATPRVAVSALPSASAGGPALASRAGSGGVAALPLVSGLDLQPASNEPFPTGWGPDNNLGVFEVVDEIRELILDQPTQLVAQRPGDLSSRRGTEAVPLPTFDTDVGELITGAVDPTIGVRAWVDQHIGQRGADGSRSTVLSRNAPIPTALTARPSFDVPMYERLRALSTDYVVPGIGGVPANTISALSVNNSFVESFLVGANHELSREFRWREYPAPLHLTWFDQFWDVGPGGRADIAPIGSWRPTALGEHAAGGERLVVLVKGELIDRFPNLSIYMIEAKEEAGEPERFMADTEPELPVFSGRLLPGVHFYGFELGDGIADQVHEAQFGGKHSQGWYFAMEEQPRSPRFGLNVGNPNDVGAFPDDSYELSWHHMKRDPADRPIFAPNGSSHLGLHNRTWDTGTWFDNAAAMATITYRLPARVLIHATAMLAED